MHILHIVHQYPPEHLGGTELYTQNLAQRQVEQGHDVTVFYPSSRSADGSSALSADEPSALPVGVGDRSRSRVFLDSFRQKQLHDALPLDGVDIVHVQHLMGLPFSLIDKIRAANIPYVVTLHDYWYPCANAQLITNTDETICAGPDARHHNCGRCALARAGLPDNAPLAMLAAPLLRYRARKLQPILTNAAAVIAPTQFVRDIYAANGLGGENYVVIPHGIRYPQLPANRKVREPSTVATLRVLYLGSIARQKGVHVLVEAFNGLPDMFELTIVGGLSSFPNYARDLLSLAAHANINFVGKVPNEEIGSLLHNTDVVVLPSLWYETSSLVLDEAFAAGVPVIASDLGVLREKVRHEVDGLLFSVGDSQALRKTLLRLHEEPSLIAELRANVRAPQTLTQHVAQIMSLYRTIVPH